MTKEELINALSKAIAKQMGCENVIDDTFWKCRAKEAEACFDVFMSQGVRSGQAHEIIDSLKRLSFYVDCEECYVVCLDIAKEVINDAVYKEQHESTSCALSCIETAAKGVEE